MARLPLRYRIADWFAARTRQVGYAWDAVVGPIENLFGRIGEGVLSAFDSFEGLESLVIRVVRVLFWPVIALGRLFGRLFPAGTGAGPLGFVGRFFSWIGVTLVRLAERLNLDGVLVLSAKLLRPVWLPIASLLGFVNAWLATRRSRELLLATPALVLALPFALVAVKGAMLGNGDIAERYKIAVRDAAEAGDFEKVELYERKLAQLGIDTRRTDYRTALKLADDGDLQDAYERMQRLAPADKPGYAAAHLWIAQRLLAGEISADPTTDSADDRQASLALAEQHLDQLEALDMSSSGLALLRAYVLALTEREQDAIAALEPYAREPGPAAVMRMRLLAQVRDLKAAREQARVVLGMTASRKWRDAATADDFESWALAAELLADVDQLDTSLQGWVRAFPDDPKPKILLSKHRREEAIRLLSAPTTAPEKTAGVIADAVRLGAPGAWTTATVARIVQQRAGSRYLQRVWEVLMESPDTPESLVSVMATSAAAEGDITHARAAFQRLVEGEEATPVVWNNYAWTLLQEPDPDPQQALEAVGRALKAAPNDFRFRETRGQVMIALGRWADAISDLEYALNGLPDATDVHRSLAAAYEATAQPQLADIHRRQAGL